MPRRLSCRCAAILFLLAGPLVSISAAQQTPSGAVSGVVRSTSGEPLRGVELVLQANRLNAITGTDGEFLLRNVPAGRYTLTARSIGYTQATRDIEVFANRATRLEITLSDAAVQLSAITVLGTRRYGSSTSNSGLKFDAPVLDVPQSVVVITSDFLQDQNATALDDVLRNVGGITPFSDYMDVTARGFRQQDEDVSYNGVKANPNNTFISPNLDNVERVEVLKGPSSVLYGSGEGGALINMVTKSPKAIAKHTLSLNGGSYDRKGGSLDFTGPLAGEKLLYRLTGHYQDANGFHRFEQKTDWHVASSATWLPFSRTSLTLKGEWLADQRKGHRNRGIAAPLGNLDALPVSWTSNEPTDRAEQESYTAELDLDQGLGNTWKFASVVRYAHADYVNQYHESRGFSCSKAPATSQLEQCAARGGRLLMRREYRDQNFLWKTLAGTATINGAIKTFGLSHRLLVNGDLTRKEKLLKKNDYASPAASLDVYSPTYGAVDLAAYANMNPVDNPNTRENNEWGISGQDLLTLLPQVKAMVGARYNSYRVFTENLRTKVTDEHTRTAYTYRGGLVWQPLQWLSTYGSVSEGFKPQTASQEDRGGPFDPLITRQMEGGFKAGLFRERLMATTSIYRIKKLNVLVPDPDTASDFYVALGEVQSKGWEVDLIGTIRSNWSVTANYARNDTKVTKDTRITEIGGRFPNAPKKSGSFWTRYDFVGLGLGVAGGATFIGERDTFDPTILPAYTAWDGALYYRWHNYNAALNIKNLTNERYFTGGYYNYQLWVAAPRTVQLTLRAEL